MKREVRVMNRKISRYEMMTIVPNDNAYNDYVDRVQFQITLSHPNEMALIRVIVCQYSVSNAPQELYLTTDDKVLDYKTYICKSRWKVASEMKTEIEGEAVVNDVNIPGYETGIAIEHSSGEDFDIYGHVNVDYERVENS